MSTRFIHDRFGECELVRVEGVDWIVRASSTLQLYRVPPSRRIDFRPISDSQFSTSSQGGHDSSSPTKGQSKPGDRFSSQGMKNLLWALRSKSRTTGDSEDREAIGPSDQGEAKSSDGQNDSPSISEPIRSKATDAPESGGGSSIRRSVLVESEGASQNPLLDSTVDPNRGRRLRRVFESLRNGLSPINTELRPFAVGIESIQDKVENLLADVTRDGGRTVVLRGAYGQGKTFCLQLLRQMALEAGFAVASTEIDARENQLDKPQSVYRSLMRNLTLPDQGNCGVVGLVDRTHREIQRRLEPGTKGWQFAAAARRTLLVELECKPLAWILSDPELIDKPELLRLLSGEPGVAVASGRRSHIIPASPNEWPAFTAGTQGDFASYLLSGIGRLTRFVGYQGLILVLDEMEKWQDLNWQAQSRAGNLLGGLIWASSAEEGSRWCRQDRLDPRWLGNCDHHNVLQHSRRCGGYPFTTAKRCSLGVAIAMTPRGEDPPETSWSEYGLLEIADLPAFSPEHLKSYMRKIFPQYIAAYELTGELTSNLLARAVKAWNERGDQSTRTAIQSILAVLDEWRTATPA